jgi:hypothetical protein
MKFQLAISLFLLLFIASCGGDDPASTNPTENLLKLDTKGQLEQAIKSSKVLCGERNLNCPSHVGKLSFWFEKEEKYYLGSCSGTLVDEQYFITNSHCLPEKLRENGSVCSSQISIQFPKTNRHPTENLKCLEVTQSFPFEDWYPDLAVLKIQRSKHDRSKITVKRNSLSHQQLAHAYTMNPDKVDKTLGTITRKECHISLDNILTLKVDHTVGNFLLTGPSCHVISGNSGSGLFNEQNELIGVIHIKIDNKILEKNLTDSYINHQSLTRMGFAVNISCLKAVNHFAGESCDIVPVGGIRGSIDKYLDYKVKQYKLMNHDETNVKAIVTKDLGLKLTPSPTRVYLESLTRMRRNLENVFTPYNNILQKALSH